MKKVGCDLNHDNAAHIATIAILLATYNGELFLQDQLESIANQAEDDWVLWVSDDGSNDKTRVILESFSAKFSQGKVNIIDGPKQGFAVNFLSLIKNKNIIAKYYAFADQDDVWLPHKLKRACAILKAMPDEQYTLYCSRTEYVTKNLEHIGYSADYKRPAIFNNALVQNIASGNTMIFNEAARELLQHTPPSVNIPLHDWWAYMVITGCGGVVFFDKQPSVRYRQHSNNLWGMNTGWINRMKRIKSLFRGRFMKWNEIHVQALSSLTQFLSIGARNTLSEFVFVRKGGLFTRLFYLNKSNLYRQTILGNVGLWVAAIFNKI